MEDATTLHFADEFLQCIFQFLDLRSTVRSRSVSKQWLAVTNAPHLWNSKFHIDFGGCIDKIYTKSDYTREWRIRYGKPVVATRAPFAFRSFYGSWAFDYGDMKTIRVMDLTTGNVVKNLIEWHVMLVACNGSILVAGRYFAGIIGQWSLDAGDSRKSWEGVHEWMVSLDGDDQIVVSGDAHGMIKVWDLCTGECLEEIKGHANSVTCLKVCPGIVLTGSADKTVKVWDKKTFECTACVEFASAVSCLTCIEDRMVVGCKGGAFSLWDISRFSLVMELAGHKKTVTSVYIDDTKIVSGGLDATARVWDLRNGECLRTIDCFNRGIESVHCIGNRIYCGGSSSCLTWTFHMN